MRAPIRDGRYLLACFLVASVTGCSAGDSVAPPPSPPPPPAALTGNLEVWVVPLVGALDTPVGVSVTVVGQGIRVSRISTGFTTVRLSGFAPGGYSIDLALIDGDTQAQRGCSIQEASRRLAVVVAGTTTSVVFEVYCRLR